jgi:hypothetical protein
VEEEREVLSVAEWWRVVLGVKLGGGVFERIFEVGRERREVCEVGFEGGWRVYRRGWGIFFGGVGEV